MADIKEEMSAIERAYKGKEIKEAILSALDKVNETNGTARFLDGHGDSEFLTQEELDQFTPFDDIPTQGSEKGISSGKIYSYLEKMGNAIDDVNVIENSSSTSETIKEKLEYLNETKRAIRKEISDKGVSISESTDFIDYAEKIGEIEMEANLDVQPLEVTENKVYEAPEGKAYNPVTVKVEFDIPVKTITKNGKYKAEDEGYDGYAEVDVSATSMLVTKEVSGEDFPAEIETLTYKAKDEGDDVIGYSEVSIDLSDKVDPEKKVTLDPEEVGEEYVFNAADDGVYGYGKFSLSIKETKKLFTVKFISEGEVVYVEADVPKGESCSYRGESLERDGYIFTGWNPQPVNIERDLKCVAQWEASEEAIERSGGSTEEGQTIDDMTWNGVMSYPNRIREGDTKYIYWMPFTCNGRKFRGGSALARCVRMGEDNTNSTWVIMFDLTAYIENVHKTPTEILFPMLKRGNASGTSASEGGFGYTDSFLYDLGNSLADAIKGCNNQYRYPGQSNLVFKNVTKPTMISESLANTNMISYPVLGNLWLLSAAEKGCPASSYEKAHDENIKSYPGFTWDLRNLTPCRTIARNFAKSSQYEKTHYNIELESILWDEMHFVGLSLTATPNTSTTGACVLPYGYVINNEGYRNAQRTLISDPGAIIRSGEVGNVGLGMTSDKLYYGFCL